MAQAKFVVWRFAGEMQRQLNENCHKRGWHGMSNAWLLMRLTQETRELQRAIKTGKHIVEEAADVANFAMMIADNNWPVEGMPPPPSIEHGG
jgi:NTP pyrophosphatase (non-canonical NTP hydrolase)